MPKEEEILERKGVRTRLQSGRQENPRRNSVSDITEFFQSITNSPVNMRKTSGRKQEKEKEKEREKAANEARANIRYYLNTPEESATSKESKNTNGDDIVVDHANCNESNEQTSAEETNNTQSVSTATQTNEDEILKAIKELAIKCTKLENSIDSPKTGLEAQLAKTQKQVSELYSDINGAVSGLKVQVRNLTTSTAENSTKITAMEDSQKRMGTLLDESKRLIHELKIMQGLIQKVTQQSSTNAAQLMDLTQRGMEQNLVLHGVDNSIEINDPKADTPMFTYKERCKHSAITFFKEKLNVDIEVEDVWKAHRMGAIQRGKVRPLVVKLSYSAKELIMENVSKLKGLSNPDTDQKYFISEQIPEGITELKKQTKHRAKILQEANDAKPKHERQKIQVIKDKILVDGKIEEPEISTPQPSQLFLEREEQKRVDDIQQKFIQTEPVVLKNSEFIALAIRVSSLEELNRSYVAVVQRHPSADHHMLGYAFKDQDQVRSGFCDDREYGAATRIRKAIFEMKSKDTAVFVLRKYGGVHLGFERFGVIENIAKQAINMLNA